VSRSTSTSIGGVTPPPNDLSEGGEAARITRLDPAHAPTGEMGTAIAEEVPLAPADEPLLEVEEPTPEMLAIVAGETLAAQREQLQLQVSQLAGHLRERLLEVDRREATVNARASELENDLRKTRLWLAEREAAFVERESELRARIEQLEEQVAARADEHTAAGFELEAREALLGEREKTVENREATLRQRELALEDQHHQLAGRESELRERRFEIDREAVALRHAQQLWQQQRDHEQRAIDRARAELAQERARVLADDQRAAAEFEEQRRAAERLLNDHGRQLDEERSAFVADRKEWEIQRERQRKAIDELRAAAEAEVADCRTRLNARQEWIERQKAGLDQVRDEALRLHRQSLEMRLISEQLWNQIGGQTSSAEVTRQVAELRRKLSEQYRLEEQQLEFRRDDLLKLSERITVEHAELSQLRSGLREWVSARQAEIEQQAAALVQRELTLDEQQQTSQRSQHEWAAQRRGYEQQIRELTARLNSPVAA
jgi:hypothetical protein